MIESHARVIVYWELMSDLANVTTKQLSLVIPVYNEEANLHALHDEITATLSGDYEVILSMMAVRMGSFEVLQTLAAVDPHVVVIRFRRNFGQTAAFAAGFDYADGAVVVTPMLTARTIRRIFPSCWKNWMKATMLSTAGGRIDRTMSCAGFRRGLPIASSRVQPVSSCMTGAARCERCASEVVKELRLYGEMHRFILS